MNTDERTDLWILQCKVCMQTFMCTTSEVKCREHAEAKHPKSDVFTCFPHLQKWQLYIETEWEMGCFLIQGVCLQNIIYQICTWSDTLWLAILLHATMCYSLLKAMFAKQLSFCMSQLTWLGFQVLLMKWCDVNY